MGEVGYFLRVLALAGALTPVGCSVLGSSKVTEPAPAAERAVGAEGARAPGSAAGMAFAEPTAPAVSPSNVEIWIDTRSQPLGAYTLTLRYDPALVRVKETGPGDMSKFPDLPRTDPSTYASGATPIAGFQTAGLSPTGRTRIATVSFLPVGRGVTTLTATLDTLVDPDGNPIAGEVSLSSDRVESR